MHTYMPANLELETLLNEHPPTFIYHIEDFKYLIGTIVRLKTQIKINTEEERSEYVELNAQLLQVRIRNYNYYLVYLMEQKVIERDYYVPKQKSFGFKLSDKYAVAGFKVETLTLGRLIKRTPKSRAKEAVLKRRYRHLTKWFNEGLQIDFEAAEAFLIRLREQEEKQDSVKAWKKYWIRWMSIDRIRRGDFRCSVDDTSRRFHSNLTNLKSELRAFLSYEGQTLCSIDIKNSQPFISTVLFYPGFYTGKGANLSLSSISKLLYHSISPSIPSILSILPSLSSSIMLVKSHESEAHSDFELYCTLVDKGRLYQYLSEKYREATGVYYDLDKNEQKRALKDKFFSVLYGGNWLPPESKNYAFRQVFRQWFPNLYWVFYYIKKAHKRNLPVILQALESEIVINRITRRIAKERPELPVYTIHDSVVTLADYADYVREVVKDEFEAAIGLQPSLSVELWTPPVYGCE
jgi:hypothetical protein